MHHATRLALLALFASSMAFARTENWQLRPQVKEDPARILPCTDLYCLAVDGSLTYRSITGGVAGYYHGGPWISTFAELNPNPHLALNSRFVVYNPAASYGVASTYYIAPFVGVSWKDEDLRLGGHKFSVIARYFDLDRQTLGAGLTLEEKEMNGMLLELKGGPVTYRFIFDGTGGYNVVGDAFAYELDVFDGLLGVAAYQFNSGDDRVPNRTTYAAFSRNPLSEHLSYGLEAASRNGAAAGLSRLEQKASWGALDSKSTIQARYYGPGFANGITGNIQHDYLAVEQEDKPFTDSMNIFVFDDHVFVAGLKTQLQYHLNRNFSVFTEAEGTRFAFREIPPRDFFLYRYGVTVLPNDRKGGGILQAYVTNKQTHATGPVFVNDYENKTSFRVQQFIGFEAKFTF